MQLTRITVEYHNNVNRKLVVEFEQDCLGLKWSDLVSKIREALQQYIGDALDFSKLFVNTGTRLHAIRLEDPILFSNENNPILEIYSDITPLNNSAHLDIRCKLKNGADVVFDIFPKEGNHRFTPHVLARLGEQTIRVVISDTPSILEPGHFSENNRKYERTVIKFVGENKDYFLSKWNEMVEIQFSKHIK